MATAAEHAGRLLLRSTQGGCRYVTTHGVAVSYEFIHVTSRAQHYCALFAQRYKTLSVLDSLLLRSTHGGCRYVTTHGVDHVDVHTERGWRDGIGAWLHLCRRAAGWPDGCIMVLLRCYDSCCRSEVRSKHRLDFFSSYTSMYSNVVNI